MSKASIDEPLEIVIGSSDFLRANFPGNQVRTTKYRPLTFVPACVFHQLRRYANFYFLVVAILASVPQLTPLEPVSVWGPLLFVIGLGVMRESFEDLSRYKADLETNAQRTQVQNDGQWKEVEAKDLYVGDIVKVTDQEVFPADVVALATSDGDGRFCIQSSLLDGDRDLKAKEALAQTQELINCSDQFVLVGTMRFEAPNDNLYGFRGTLAIGEKPVPVGPRNFIIRGTTLKNSAWVVGLVVYTGDDSKARQHSTEPLFKQSRVEYLANWLIIYLIGCTVILALIVLIGAGVWQSRYGASYAQFVPLRYGAGPESFLAFLGALVLFSGLIPASLVVTVETVKMAQAFFINKDHDMLDRFGGRFSRTFNSLVNEDLGMVKYVLADKTGTLTANTLEFRAAFIGDTMFGDQGWLEGRRETKRKVTYASKTEGITYAFADRRLTPEGRAETAQKHENIAFFDARNKELFRLKNQRELIENMLLAMATCHSCSVLDDSENRGKVRYSGVSQDEVAIVDAARHLGYALKGSNSATRKIDVDGQASVVEVLFCFEFSSARRRSSVILRHDGYIKHFIKGAGEEIGGRLNSKVSQPYLEKAEDAMDKFSTAGLRTVCFGMKVLTLEDYRDVEQKMRTVAQRADKEEALESIADAIERDFLLLGCVGIEDKLQEGVVETIADLRKAEINVWIVTGDKAEVAESVAYGCRLLTPMSQKVYLRKGDNLDNKYAELRQFLDHKHETETVGLVIDGFPISELESRADLSLALCQDVFPRLDTVIAARMSPTDKAMLASTLRRQTGEVVLAIGDGTNDIEMLHSASVGIGIYGQDGSQAVQASDYGLVSFRCLWKLLFVHGHWAYVRISELLLMFYYKNMLFVLPLLLFCFFNGFSVQTFYDSYQIVLFHLLYSCLPLIARGAFDQDLYYKKWTSRSKTSLLENKRLDEYRPLKRYYPRLYYIGQRNVLFR